MCTYQKKKKKKKRIYYVGLCLWPNHGVKFNFPKKRKRKKSVGGGQRISHGQINRERIFLFIDWQPRKIMRIIRCVHLFKLYHLSLVSLNLLQERLCTKIFTLFYWQFTHAHNIPWTHNINLIPWLWSLKLALGSLWLYHCTRQWPLSYLW